MLNAVWVAVIVAAAFWVGGADEVTASMAGLTRGSLPGLRRHTRPVQPARTGQRDEAAP